MYTISPDNGDSQGQPLRYWDSSVAIDFTQHVFLRAEKFFGHFFGEKVVK